MRDETITSVQMRHQSFIFYNGYLRSPKSLQIKAEAVILFYQKNKGRPFPAAVYLRIQPQLVFGERALKSWGQESTVIKM